MLFYIIRSSVFDLLCAGNTIFLRGGLAKFVRACVQLRGNIDFIIIHRSAFNWHMACQKDIE